MLWDSQSQNFESLDFSYQSNTKIYNSQQQHARTNFLDWTFQIMTNILVKLLFWFLK